LIGMMENIFLQKRIEVCVTYILFTGNSYHFLLSHEKRKILLVEVACQYYKHVRIYITHTY
jgi:hypothetical protein